MESAQYLFVPMKVLDGGVRTVWTARSPDGTRVGVAFTSRSLMTQIMGPSWAGSDLSATVLRSLLAPLGVDRIQVDPDLVVPAAALPRITAAPRRVPRVDRPDRGRRTPDVGSAAGLGSSAAWARNASRGGASVVL